MYHLFSLKDCFLAKRRWQRVMRDWTVGQVNDHPYARDRIALADMFMAHLSKVPTVLRYGYPLLEAKLRGLNRLTQSIRYS